MLSIEIDHRNIQIFVYSVPEIKLAVGVAPTYPPTPIGRRASVTPFQLFTAITYSLTKLKKIS
jgi:hypothetical protein